MANVNIINTKQSFQSFAANSILDDALNAGLDLDYNCKDGACGSCEATLLSGSVSESKWGDNSIIHEGSHLEPKVLLCQCKVITDISVNVTPKVKYIQVPIKVLSITKTLDTAIVVFKLPTSVKFNYKAGQYINFNIDGKIRSYSLASSPTQQNILEIHVRYHPDGIFSKYVWDTLAVNNVLRVIGPKGNFYLQEQSLKKIMLVATGTGFAPLKGILQYMQDSNINDKDVTLILGNRREENFYDLDFLDSLVNSKLNIKIIKVLSQDNKAGYYAGHVTSYIRNEYMDLSDYDIYACGNINMIKDVYKLALENNLNKESFYSDAFTPA